MLQFGYKNDKRRKKVIAAPARPGSSRGAERDIFRKIEKIFVTVLSLAEAGLLLFSKVHVGEDPLHPLIREPLIHKAPEGAGGGLSLHPPGPAAHGHARDDGVDDEERGQGPGEDLARPVGDLEDVLGHVTKIFSIFRKISRSAPREDPGRAVFSSGHRGRGSPKLCVIAAFFSDFVTIFAKNGRNPRRGNFLGGNFAGSVDRWKTVCYNLVTKMTNGERRL